MQKLKMRLSAIFLLAATLLFWGFYDRYEPAGEILLDSPSIEDATRVRGLSTESGGVFSLCVTNAKQAASIRFTLTDATEYKFVRAGGWMKTEKVVVGENPWRSARMVLIQYGDNGKWIPGHHEVAKVEGTTDWAQFEDIFEIDPKTVKVDFSLDNLGASGAAHFKELFALPVKIRTSFYIWWGLFVFSWLVMGVLFFKRCRLHKRKLRIFILLNALAIIVGTLMPGKWIDRSSKWVADEVIQVVQHTPGKAAEGKTSAPAEKKVVPSKETQRAEQAERFQKLVSHSHSIGHFTLFAALCFLVYCSAALEGQHRSYYFRVMFDILVFAAITESLQYLTMDRTPGFSDFLIDLQGMILALIIFTVLRGGFHFAKRMRNKSEIV